MTRTIMCCAAVLALVACDGGSNSDDGGPALDDGGPALDDGGRALDDGGPALDAGMMTSNRDAGPVDLDRCAISRADWDAMNADERAAAVGAILDCNGGPMAPVTSGSGFGAPCDANSGCDSDACIRSNRGPSAGMCSESCEMGDNAVTASTCSSGSLCTQTYCISVCNNAETDCLPGFECQGHFCIPTVTIPPDRTPNGEPCSCTTGALVFGCPECASNTCGAVGPDGSHVCTANCGAEGAACALGGTCTRTEGGISGLFCL